MSKKFNLTHFHESARTFWDALSAIASDRKVRSVVTRSGLRARGVFPSIKAPARARYESLVERDTLRVLEVSS